MRDITDDPTCPYCGHKEREWFDLELEFEKPTDIVCSECEKEFTVTMEKVIFFKNKRQN